MTGSIRSESKKAQILSELQSEKLGIRTENPISIRIIYNYVVVLLKFIVILYEEKRGNVSGRAKSDSQAHESTVVIP